MELARRLSPGRPWPLGARFDGQGVNFALFSAHASRVELVAMIGDEQHEFALERQTDGVWHGYLPGGCPRLRYAYRVFGSPQRAIGDRFDPSRLLLDPCARRLTGEFSWAAATDRSSAYGLLCAVCDDTAPPFDWGGDRRPLTPWDDSVLYEIHVRGASMRHPEVPEPLRGTYLGLASPAMIAHYRRLGITALNLLPVQQHIDEARLAAAGLSNYWGYNPINFFAAEPRYARDPARAMDEFRAMVRELHRHDIEVILDVVFNHTAEVDAEGPTLSWRGIDNRVYYRLGNGGRYENHSGCGNSLKLGEPRVLQQVMDALRYWVNEGHVDGFRFDLATTLTRDSAFLDTIAQEPALQGIKLIAEPWDVGPDGYRLGRFPAGWSEWNDRFRDQVRGFWLTRDFGTNALAQRLAGSSEAFRHRGRAPQAGINFIAAHDGFTLTDLTRYRDKHNEANGEHNRDGHAVNFSNNCGCEGDSADPAIVHRRDRVTRALLASLFLAQGVPMLQAGDEFGRSQQGNNNAYCHDSELTWLDWATAQHTRLDYVARLIELRRRLSPLRRRRWLTGEIDGRGEIDCRWLHPEGHEMGVSDWHDPALHAFGFELADDDNLERILCLFNRDAEGRAFALPPGLWIRRFDSTDESATGIEGQGQCELAGEAVQVWGRLP